MTKKKLVYTQSTFNCHIDPGRQVHFVLGSLQPYVPIPLCPHGGRNPLYTQIASQVTCGHCAKRLPKAFKDRGVKYAVMPTNQTYQGHFKPWLGITFPTMLQAYDWAVQQGLTEGWRIEHTTGEPNHRFDSGQLVRIETEEPLSYEEKVCFP